MNLQPGTTATGTGTVAVTGLGLATWHLSVADTTSNAGHLARAAVGCAGSQPLTTNALTATASGTAVGTHGTGTVTIGPTAQEIASGTLLDTVTVSFNLVLPNTERMLAGCVFSTTLTYTLQ
jgi:hypothetical protein